MFITTKLFLTMSMFDGKKIGLQCGVCFRQIQNGIQNGKYVSVMVFNATFNNISAIS
jgi:hypothetical protein